MPNTGEYCSTLANTAPHRRTLLHTDEVALWTLTWFSLLKIDFLSSGNKYNNNPYSSTLIFILFSAAEKKQLSLDLTLDAVFCLGTRVKARVKS